MTILSQTDPEEMGTIYDSGNACPLDGCEPSGLMTNTYNQASMGPHDRMAEGVSGMHMCMLSVVFAR